MSKPEDEKPSTPPAETPKAPPAKGVHAVQTPAISVVMFKKKISLANPGRTSGDEAESYIAARHTSWKASETPQGIRFTTEAGHYTLVPWGNIAKVDYTAPTGGAK